MCAAIRRTSTAGSRRAPRGGTGRRSGPVSSARKPRPSRPRTVTGERAPCGSASPRGRIRSPSPIARLGKERGLRPIRDHNGLELGGPHAQHAHDRGRPPPECRRCLPDRGRSCSGEPRSPHGLARRPIGLRRCRARGRGLRARRGHRPPLGRQARRRAGGRSHRNARHPDALRSGSGRRAGRLSGSRSGATCRAWGRTCRTIYSLPATCTAPTTRFRRPRRNIRRRSPTSTRKAQTPGDAPDLVVACVTLPVVSEALAGQYSRALAR